MRHLAASGIVGADKLDVRASLGPDLLGQELGNGFQHVPPDRGKRPLGHNRSSRVARCIRRIRCRATGIFQQGAVVKKRTQLTRSSLPLVRIDAIIYRSSLHGSANQTKFLEFPQVLGNGGLGQANDLGEVPRNAGFAGHQMAQNGNSGGMPQGFGPRGQFQVLGCVQVGSGGSHGGVFRSLQSKKDGFIGIMQYYAKATHTTKPNPIRSGC